MRGLCRIAILRAEELKDLRQRTNLALGIRMLKPGSHYQAEKMADWIRLKAQIKAHEAEHLARWAAAQ